MRPGYQCWLPISLPKSTSRKAPHLHPSISRLVHRWVESFGLESASYGTHSMRRTKAAQIYRKTGNLRAVQLLLGHTKLESTVRYLGIEVDDALNIAEQIELNPRPPASCRWSPTRQRRAKAEPAATADAPVVVHPEDTTGG